MTTEGRILAIEDESQWRENFAAWIPREVAAQDSAATAEEAAEKLRRLHYDLVLLDLSMDVSDPSNRDTRSIQEYLAAKPEGTAYFVVSSTADREEARDAAYKSGAAWVFFKTDDLRRELLERAASVIENAAYSRGQAIVTAQKQLIPDQIREHEFFSALKLGAGDLYAILAMVSRAFAPLAPHADRPHCVISKGCGVGLFWSRRHGAAVSLVMAHENIADSAALAALENWLGFKTRGSVFFDKQMHHVRIRAFEEPTISDAHFELPVIKPPS